MQLHKNDKIELIVTSLGYRGEGVARHEQMPIFIDGALPNERVRAVIIAAKRDYAVAKLLEVLSPSPDRVPPRCPYFLRCGGCNLRHLSYEAQCQAKRAAAVQTIRKIYKAELAVMPITPSEKIDGYRNKLSLPVRAVAGKAAIGMYAYNSHRIIEIDRCPLQTDRINGLIPSLKALAAQLQPFDEQQNSGQLKHLVCRDVSGRLSLTVVSKTDISDKLRQIFNKGELAVDELWLNICPKNSNVIFGDKTVLIGGEEGEYNVMGKRIKLHPKGFLQVNEGIMTKLYTQLIRLVDESGQDVLIDAYSGSGLLTALLAPSVKKIIGIEIVSEAVASSNALMKREGIQNAESICGDCAKVLPRLINTYERAAVLLDPPRSGCDKGVIDALNASGAESVIYVSCNPATLARDLMLLTAYSVQSLQPYDMFPQTSHVELLAVLKRR